MLAPQKEYIIKDPFLLQNAAFESAALDLFLFQYENNTLYRTYCGYLNKTPGQVRTLNEIPFLPARFFKSHRVTSSSFEASLIFESSGTTGSINSRHFIKDISLYEKSFRLCFEQFYGNANQYCIIGLLPSYLERGNSSLLYMVKHLIQQSGHPGSGFYLDDFEKLQQQLLDNEARQQKTLLIGVTYALLSFAEKFPLQLKHTTVMETGGMKGRKKEITRDEVHHFLKQQFHIPSVHSEYGMTELLSQAYAGKNGIFHCPGWMKILLRSEDDPFYITSTVPAGKTASGVINIIDLANIYSCAFIATDDVGKLHEGGSFEILGRLDNCDIRGCSLLTA